MKSKNYVVWQITLNRKLCTSCLLLNGKIYAINEPMYPLPPAHPNCKCRLVPLQAKIAGTATTQWQDGADWWLVYQGKLPDYYITYQERSKSKWLEILFRKLR